MNSATWIQWAWLIIPVILALLAIIFVVAAALWLRFRPFIGLVGFLSSDNLGEIFPPADRESARLAAQQRREFIDRYLSEDIPRGEVIEVPQELSDIARRDLSPIEALAQSHILRWQVRDEAFLLLGRVVDLILALARDLHIDPHRLAIKVKLTSLVRAGRRRSRNLFPYVIIIESEETQFLRDQLRRFQSWLGIGVLLQDPRPLDAFGMCQVTGGEEGSVGGYIDSERGTFLVTCSHVLSPNCISVWFKTGLQSATKNQTLPCYEMAILASRCKGL